MLRRHRRGGRRFTVSIQRDFALVAGSYIPFQLQLAGDGQDKPGPGGMVGIDAGGFRTYSVLAMPPDWISRKVGDVTMTGQQWSVTSTYRERRIGVGTGRMFRYHRAKWSLYDG